MTAALSFLCVDAAVIGGNVDKKTRNTRDFYWINPQSMICNPVLKNNEEKNNPKETNAWRIP